MAVGQQAAPGLAAGICAKLSCVRVLVSSTRSPAHRNRRHCCPVLCLRIMQSSRHSHHWRRRRRRRRKLNLSILNTVTGLDVSRSGVVASCPRAPVLQSKLDPFIASATRMLQAAAAPGSVRNANANERVLSTQWLRCTCIFIAHGFALWSRRLPEVEGAPDHFSNHLVGHVIAANISTIQSSRRWSHSASRI
ncbi:hypothetical protein SNOG_08972 [Parastagonospora nodorum SN15]|uniref:Uncharacterized protein n=1 Tax=Phaeosphaeria nodorum (strain SN15 / ATCC MYA-4574 / FGSC 10173) TaxID=321614 RepID=Q0UGZ2_PHANO|nr:hypothetical protein SNOG_08972 [Parastagonospora nodorum SN15]EAT84140.1 hypothetical protein SNOG_08972 [Parastagonospora nodorum SN15]